MSRPSAEAAVAARKRTRTRLAKLAERNMAKALEAEVSAY
jgi:hypothetical protein